jgi:hypothetical protein
MGMLLSEQETVYGINMFESLSQFPEDQVLVDRMVERDRCTREEAALSLFHRRYGPSTTATEELAMGHHPPQRSSPDASHRSMSSSRVDSRSGSNSRAVSGPAQQFIRPGQQGTLPPPLPLPQYQQEWRRPNTQQQPPPPPPPRRSLSRNNSLTSRSSSFRIDADAEALSQALRLSQEEHNGRPGVEGVQGLSVTLNRTESFQSDYSAYGRAWSAPSTRPRSMQGGPAGPGHGVQRDPSTDRIAVPRERDTRGRGEENGPVHAQVHIRGSSEASRRPSNPYDRTIAPMASNNVASANNGAIEVKVNRKDVATLMNMGFSKEQVVRALVKHGHNVDRAANSLLG